MNKSLFAVQNVHELYGPEWGAIAIPVKLHFDGKTTPGGSAGPYYGVRFADDWLAALSVGAAFATGVGTSTNSQSQTVASQSSVYGFQLHPASFTTFHHHSR